MNPYISPEARARLARDIHRMPAYIEEALKENGLEEAYRRRPAYQKNDYVGWINRAKREGTRQKRLAQMVDELEGGDKYMKMDYGP
jgi:uncharacterized protein YdeI (YjbR/CyaY-like superfamily)